MEVLGLPIASATASMSLRSEHQLPSDNSAKTRHPPDSSTSVNFYEALMTQNAVAHKGHAHTISSPPTKDLA